MTTISFGSGGCDEEFVVVASSSQRRRATCILGGEPLAEERG